MSGSGGSNTNEFLAGAEPALDGWSLATVNSHVKNSPLKKVRVWISIRLNFNLQFPPMTIKILPGSGGGVAQFLSCEFTVCCDQLLIGIFCVTLWAPIIIEIE